jgi:predicted transcriptional regulator
MCLGEKRQTSYEILAYLVENPGAQDTLEGVAHWWLLEQRIEDQTAKVQEALDELVSKGLVIENKGPDARFHYRINRDRMKRISAILSRDPDDEM